MRIALDAEAANASAREGFDGHKTFCFNLVRALLDSERGHTFDLYMKRPPVYPFLRSGRNSRCHAIPMRWTLTRRVQPVWRDPWRQLLLLPRLANDRPDVYFQVAHDAQPLWCPGQRVYAVYDIAFKLPRFRATFSEAELNKLERPTDAAVRSAEHLIAASDRTKADLCEVYGLSEAKVTTVYHGCRLSPSDFPAAGPELDSRLAALGVQRPYLLFVGVLEPRKNMANLLRAYAILRTRCSVDHQLVLAGRPGWLHEQALEPLESLPSSVVASVVRTGYVSDESLLALYAGASLYVSPGLHEGFGHPLLEAMAAGVPVAAARAGSTPEVAGDAATLFDPLDVEDMANAMLSILRSKEMAVELVARGHARRERFTWKATAEAILDVMEAVV